jgi:NAD(P) transhydrogenase subunit alpha
MTTVLIARERRPGEARVAATPETVKKLRQAGLDVVLEAGAGEGAFFADAAYEAAGASVAGDPRQSFDTADVVLRVGPLAADEAAALRSGAILVGLLAPHRHLDTVRALRERRVTALAMELVPRTTRAQTMDALSSQASVGGYKAVLLAAGRLPKYFPLMMTAAGTVPPARVLVMGAGVAGLQAIATAKRLGAVVEVSDVRAAVQEQVESLGAKFIPLPMQESGEGQGGYAREMTPEFLARQREIVARHVATADVVITTAQVPGKRAPILVTREMVESMKPGGVIVDLAAAEGGNCELSRPDEELEHGRVRILAPTNLAASMPVDASTIYARNVAALLLYLWRDGKLTIDAQDPITGPTLLTHDGAVLHAPTAALL